MILRQYDHYCVWVCVCVTVNCLLWIGCERPLRIFCFHSFLQWLDLPLWIIDLLLGAASTPLSLICPSQEHLLNSHLLHSHISAFSLSHLSLFVFPLLISSLCPSSQHKPDSSFLIKSFVVVVVAGMRLWHVKFVPCQTLDWTDGAPALTHIHKTTVINYEGEEAWAKSSGIDLNIIELLCFCHFYSVF